MLRALISVTQDEIIASYNTADKHVEFSYNAANQMTGIERYHDLVGNAANLVVDSSFDYDSRGRLTSIDHGTITGYAFDYDNLKSAQRDRFHEPEFQQRRHQLSVRLAGQLKTATSTLDTESYL